MTEKHTNDIVKLYFEDTGFDLDAFNGKWKPQTFELVSELEHTIPVYYITAANNYENKTVVLVHWHESNHVAMYPIAELFLDKGWNVVLYDQRAHGKNTAKTVTFGYLESKDLEQVVSFAKEKVGNNVVGVYGQSMGAATIGYYLGSFEAQQELSFAVMDCPYSSMYDEISWEITKGNLPILANTLCSLGNVFNQVLNGYTFKKVDIVGRVKNSNTPTLLVHSKADHKCPYYMAEELYQAIPHNKKKFVTIEHSEHLFSFWDEPDRYTKELFNFINEYSY